MIEAESKLPKSQFVGLQISDRPFTEQDIELGKALFMGHKRLANGGPPCVTCHTFNGAEGFGGGRLGPDLSKAYERLQGRKAMGAWLYAPATPTMNPTFKKAALKADEEILPLLALFESTARSGGGRRPHRHGRVLCHRFRGGDVVSGAVRGHLESPVPRGSRSAGGNERPQGIGRPILKSNGSLVWIKDESNPEQRGWEEFYRNRWQHDKIIRSTHGVNCTGGCSWNIYVKDGIVTWEMQALDYPLLESGIPPYEPRGCQRGISYSWYLYSPLRVKYPYVRGALLDLWKKARAAHEDPVEAWRSLVEDPEKRQRWQKARGKGGFRRFDWDTALEMVAASNVYTAKKYGPDRIVGFSPIPAMSMISFASGSRYLQLIGGTLLSFYDWYSDLPPASPEVWGEQTDVHESADWYNAKLLAVMGSNLKHDAGRRTVISLPNRATTARRCGSSRRTSTR